MALIGYARVSTAEQNLGLQRDALAGVGCETVFEDHASGAKAERPGLADALVHLRRGDRNLDGAMSWARPMPLTEFEEDGPLAELRAPAGAKPSRGGVGLRSAVARPMN